MAVCICDGDEFWERVQRNSYLICLWTVTYVVVFNWPFYVVYTQNTARSCGDTHVLIVAVYTLCACKAKIIAIVNRSPCLTLYIFIRIHNNMRSLQNRSFLRTMYVCVALNSCLHVAASVFFNTRFERFWPWTHSRAFVCTSQKNHMKKGGMASLPKCSLLPRSVFVFKMIHHHCHYITVAHS